MGLIQKTQKDHLLETLDILSRKIESFRKSLTK